jgi:transcriptional regulator GlxA family with amidase domain
VALVYPGVEMLDVMGPLDIFAAANELVRSQRGRAKAEYALTMLSPGGSPVLAFNGLQITPHGRLSELPGKVDTLLVPGAYDIVPHLGNVDLLEAIRLGSDRDVRDVSSQSAAVPSCWRKSVCSTAGVR